MANMPDKLATGHWSRKNFAPVLFLSIDDKDASDLLGKLREFTHKRSKVKAAETKFVFRNDNRNLCDDPRLFPNVRWRFRYGYLNDLSPIHEALIREVAPEYGDKLTVSITLYDESLSLSTTSSGRNWGNVQSSDVAKQIARLHKMTAVVDDSNDAPKHAWIQPSSVNDIQYLRDLAAMIDYEVYVQGSPPTLYYKKKPYDESPLRVLTYFDDPTENSYVKSFKPKVKGLGPVKTGVSGADAKKGDASKANTASGDKDTPALASGKVSVDGHSGDADVYNDEDAPGGGKSGVTKPAPDASNSVGLAHAARQQMLDKANEATSEHPLTPSLVTGGIYIWQGIDKQLSGRWYVEEATDKISGTGADTSVTWKRNARGQGDDNKKKNDKPANSGDGGNDSDVATVDVDGHTGDSDVSRGKR